MFCARRSLFEGFSATFNHLLFLFFFFKYQIKNILKKMQFRKLKCLAAILLDMLLTAVCHASNTGALFISFIYFPSLMQIKGFLEFQLLTLAVIKVLDEVSCICGFQLFVSSYSN